MVDVILTLEDAIALAVKSHDGQVDKVGQTYILHPLRVMFAVEGDTARMAGILHDVVEDTDVTFDQLREMGYNEEVIEALDCLTRRDDETYAKFVERANANPIARQVKIADIEDNMDIRRLHEVTDTVTGRLQRYLKAWRRLKED